jgi:hypothetical protein
VAAILEDDAPSRARYEPGHPDADAEGYVAVPNVDVPEEMVDMVSAARAYSGQSHGHRPHPRHDSARVGAREIAMAVTSIGTCPRCPARLAVVKAPARPDVRIRRRAQQLDRFRRCSSADANAAVGRMLDGTGDVHEAVIAMQKADTMLQLTVQIRNKIVQAYQDIMRMPM